MCWGPPLSSVIINKLQINIVAITTLGPSDTSGGDVFTRELTGHKRGVDVFFLASDSLADMYPNFQAKVPRFRSSWFFKSRAN